MFDLGSGVSALLGAAIGGGVTFAGTYLNIKFQSSQAKHLRMNQRVDKRQDAHETMLIATYSFLERSRELVECLNDGISSDDAHAKYVESWEELNTTRGVAMLAGPKPVSAALMDMMAPAVEYSRLVDRYAKGRGKSQSLEQVHHDFYEKRLRYIDVAREYLSLDE